VGRPRKDGRARQFGVRPYVPAPVESTGPLSGEDALRLLEMSEIQDRPSVVERICRQVAEAGACRKNC
jgi:hypothetical protein